MKTVIITGGIGSGKSVVCGILRDMGMTAQYNADKKVKSLYDEHPTLLNSIEEALGEPLRDSTGQFQAQKLANIIFRNPEARKAVENLVFPALIEDFEDFARKHAGHEYIIFESATVLERTVFDGLGDKTVLVDAPYIIRMNRAAIRDRVTTDTIEARMVCQPLMNALSEGYVDPRIDAVILNDAGIDELKERTSEVFSHLFDN